MNNKVSSPNMWSLLRWLVLALCPPLATLLPQVQALTLHNRLLAAVLIAIYELMLFLFSFGNKIWQQLEPRWVSQLADWIDQRKEWIVSHSYRHYCQYLTYQHRDVDVKGLSAQGIYTLALEQTFVELSITPTPAHQAVADPIRVASTLKEGAHPIYDYLSAPSLKGQHLVILGAPGSGKTTLLKHLVLTCLKKRALWHPFRGMHRFPVLLFLREHVEAIKAKAEEFALEDAICAHALKWWEQRLTPKWARQQLLKRHSLICLDGLDEVADEATRAQVVTWVERQMIRYSEKGRFLITSRPHGYKNMSLQGVMVLEVRPFTDKQIEQFINNWYLANEIMSSQKSDRGVHLKAKNGAKDLLRRLRSTPALYALAVNPLLLTMIATVHRYHDVLPDKRVALYAEICDVFLGKRDASKGLMLELTAAQKREVLQPLAYHMMQKGITDISLEDTCQIIAQPLTSVNPDMSPSTFVSLVEQTSGLFLEREVGSYTFAHLTFQEYLAAVYVIKEQGLGQELAAQVSKSWWHETIRLYCAQTDATDIVTACLRESPPSVSVLTLAWECQQEALKLDREVRLQLEQLLTQGIEDADQEHRHLVAEVLLAQRKRQMIPLEDGIFLDTSLVTYAEYQLFLDEQYAQGKYLQPDHWNTLSFPSGQGDTPVLGVRHHDALAFCQWLSKRDAGLWQYRLPNEKEGERTPLKADKGMNYWLGEGKLYVKETPLNLSIVLPYSFDFGLDSSVLLNIANSLIDESRPHALDLDLDLDLDLVRDLVRDLDRALVRAFNRILSDSRTLVANLIKKGAPGEAIQALRQYTSNLSYLLASFYFYLSVLEERSTQQSKKRFLFLRKLRPHQKGSLEVLGNTYLLIYVLSVMLKGRAKGSIPAWEGILLVREQKKVEREKS